MDNILESRPATMKFYDAHNILTDIGYNFTRQNGSSHKVYSKPNSRNIVLSPHGKDISPASTREVHNAIKVHKLRKLSEAIVEGNLIAAKELFEEIIREKAFQKLQEKKSTIEFYSEGSVKLKNKKSKKEVEKRIKYNLDKAHLVGDVSGRTQMKILPSNIIKQYSKKAEALPWNRSFKLQKESITD